MHGHTFNCAVFFIKSILSKAEVFAVIMKNAAKKREHIVALGGTGKN